MDLPSRHVFKMYLLESFQVPSSTSTDLQSTCNHWNGEPRRRHPSSTHPPPKIYAEQRHLYLANAKKKPPLYIFVYIRCFLRHFAHGTKWKSRHPFFGCSFDRTKKSRWEAPTTWIQKFATCTCNNNCSMACLQKTAKRIRGAKMACNVFYGYILTTQGFEERTRRETNVVKHQQSNGWLT